MSDTVTVDDLLAEFETETPYGLAREANKVFAQLGVDKRFPGPFMYNYVKKGTITGTKYEGSMKGVRVSRDVFLKWLEGYIAKNVS